MFARPCVADYAGWACRALMATSEPSWKLQHSLACLLACLPRRLGPQETLGPKAYPHSLACLLAQREARVDPVPLRTSATLVSLV